MVQIIAFVIIFLTFAIVPNVSENTAKNLVSIRADQRGYRLPNNTKPISYEIYISSQIDKGFFDFDGSVEIEIIVLEDSNNITLQHRNLSINSIKLSMENGRKIPILPYQNFTSHSTIMGL